MPDDRTSADTRSASPEPSASSSRPGLIRSIAHRLAGEPLALPIEGRLASFDGATGWLNTEPLTPEGLRGRVVLVDFWTYTCVNWLRTLPYVRAWAAKYADAGLTVVGVHTPEFGFERTVDNVIAAARDLRVDYPIALDSDYGVWSAFANHYWPARVHRRCRGPDPIPPLRRRRIRRAGDGDPAAPARRRRRRASTRTWWSWTRSASKSPPTGERCSRPRPTSATARAPGSPRATSRGSISPHVYAAPARLPPQLNGRSRAAGRSPGTRRCRTSPAGASRSASTRATSTSSWAPQPTGASIPFRVLLDGQPAGVAGGTDVDADGRASSGTSARTS